MLSTSMSLLVLSYNFLSCFVKPKITGDSRFKLTRKYKLNICLHELLHKHVFQIYNTVIHLHTIFVKQFSKLQYIFLNIYNSLLHDIKLLLLLDKQFCNSSVF